MSARAAWWAAELLTNSTAEMREGVRAALKRGAWGETLGVMKAAGDTAYAGYLAALDRQLDLLENGTSRMAPRPYQDKIMDEALPPVKRIYEEPYE